MSISQAFADIALNLSMAFPIYHDALAKWPGTPTEDAGGSITTPGTPVEKECSVQVDAATESMRQAEGYTDRDMRMLILSATLDGDMDTAAKVEVLTGPHSGTWTIASVDRDPMGIYWECRGRRMNGVAVGGS